MKILNIFLIFVLTLSFMMAAQETKATGEVNKTDKTDKTDSTKLENIDITLGSIRFPKPFIHSQKDYEAGIYYITLTAKAGVTYFNVYTQTQELLFEERAIVKPAKGHLGKSKYRVKKGFSNKQEYFILKVITSTQRIMAFFLVKKK